MSQAWLWSFQVAQAMAHRELEFGEIGPPAAGEVTFFLELSHFDRQRVFLCGQFLKHGAGVDNLDLDLVALADQQLHAVPGLFAVQVALKALLIETGPCVLQVFQPLFEAGQVALFGGDQFVQRLPALLVAGQLFFPGRDARLEGTLSRLEPVQFLPGRFPLWPNLARARRPPDRGRPGCLTADG